MDVVGVVVGCVGVALAVKAMIRDGSTRSKLAVLQRSVESERDLRDLDEALTAIHTTGLMIPTHRTDGDQRHQMERFDLLWSTASGRAHGHLHAASAVVPTQAVRRLRRSLSSVSTHLALLREVEYETSGLGGLEGVTMEVLEAVAVVQAHLKRRSAA